MSDYIPYAWEINGTRRPLPPLSQAIKDYGKEVDYPQPKYVKEGYCKWCGEKIENKRRKEFCSNEHSVLWNRWATWNRGRSAYSYRICCRDNFTCQDCGLFMTVKNKYGVDIPVDDGIEIHHIKPVSKGGGDEPSNLICLCHECHQERHRRMKNNV